MKKNALARMSAPNETIVSRFRKFHILPKLLCLLLALIVWLAVVDLNAVRANDHETNTTTTEQAQ